MIINKDLLNFIFCNLNVYVLFEFVIMKNIYKSYTIKKTKLPKINKGTPIKSEGSKKDKQYEKKDKKSGKKSMNNRRPIICSKYSLLQLNLRKAKREAAWAYARFDRTQQVLWEKEADKIHKIMREHIENCSECTL